MNTREWHERQRELDRSCLIFPSKAWNKNKSGYFIPSKEQLLKDYKKNDDYSVHPTYPEGTIFG